MFEEYDDIKQTRKKEHRDAEKEYQRVKKQKPEDEVSAQELEQKKDDVDAKKDAFDIVSLICAKCKATSNKNNILVEAATLFFDADFIEKADSKTTLLCFTNGVWDFSEGVNTFRPGVPQDYLTKCTHVAYIPENERYAPMVSEIQTFFHQLFPTEGLHRYMWDHLASCLVGGNENQTFNIYLGSGSNGKSKLTALMAHCFGDYKGTVPITLVTQKRGDIGGTSSEIVQLKGIRYAVMQEPTKNSCTLNEGVMKEITGGDPITARGLYKDSETFIPQLSLVVCSNILFDINSTDDGTWRRIRVVRFMSKFVDNINASYDTDARFIFPKDYTLEGKLKNWAPTFISMLVSRYLLTRGAVTDCEEVLEESHNYQKGQDMIACFIAECVEVVPVPEANLNPTKRNYFLVAFQDWAKTNFTGMKASPPKDFYAALEKKFGKPTANSYRNISLKKEENAHIDTSVN
jgi:P4 family phage/plasmid primase-like protien